jgi:putative membrane protein
MKLIVRIIGAFLINAASLVAADFFIDGFSVVHTLQAFAVTAALLTAITLVVRPVLAFLFTPFIILTFGLFSLVLNAALLFALDIWSVSITIEGLRALAYGTLLITATTTFAYAILKKLL